MRKILFTVMVALGLLITSPGSVMASAVVPITTDSNSVAQIKLSPVYITLLISLALPLLNGLLTKLTDSGGLKAMLLVALNALNTFITAAVMVGGSYVFTKESISTFIVTTAIAMAAQSRLYTPLGLTSSSIAVPDMRQGHEGQVVHIPGKLAEVGRK